jgi:hypothetical protein
MKRINTLVYLLYKLLLFSFALIFLSSIVIIVVTNSWLYLLLYFPALIYVYKWEVNNLKKNKNKGTNKKS